MKKGKGREIRGLPPSFKVDTTLQHIPVIAPCKSTFDLGPVILNSSSLKFLVGTTRIEDIISEVVYICDVRIPSEIIRSKVGEMCEQLKLSPNCFLLRNIPLVVSFDTKALICTDYQLYKTNLKPEILPLMDIFDAKRSGESNKLTIQYLILGSVLLDKTLDIHSLEEQIPKIIPNFLKNRKLLPAYLYNKIIQLLGSQYSNKLSIKIVPK